MLYPSVCFSDTAPYRLSPARMFPGPSCGSRRACGLYQFCQCQILSLPTLPFRTKHLGCYIIPPQILWLQIATKPLQIRPNDMVTILTAYPAVQSLAIMHRLLSCSPKIGVPQMHDIGAKAPKRPIV